MLVGISALPNNQTKTTTALRTMKKSTLILVIVFMITFSMRDKIFDEKPLNNNHALWGGFVQGAALPASLSHVVLDGKAEGYVPKIILPPKGGYEWFVVGLAAGLIFWVALLRYSLFAETVEEKTTVKIKLPPLETDPILEQPKLKKEEVPSAAPDAFVFKDFRFYLGFREIRVPVVKTGQPFDEPLQAILGIVQGLVGLRALQGESEGRVDTTPTPPPVDGDQLPPPPAEIHVPPDEGGGGVGDGGTPPDRP